MEKRRLCGWIVMFALFIVFPGFAGRFHLFQTEAEGGQEYRKLAEKPTFSRDNFLTYGSLYEAYYNDHLPWRDAIIRRNNIVNMKVLGEKRIGETLIGQDRWLYLREGADFYKGVSLYTEEELFAIKDKLERITARQRQKGGDFVLFIAPNKETIYPDYLPEYIHRGEITKTEQLLACLEDSDIKIVYPREVLMENRDFMQLYHKWDTHWNRVGAYLGCCELARALGNSLPQLETLGLFPWDYEEQDLLRQMNLYGYWGMEKEYDFVGYAPYAVEVSRWDSGNRNWYDLPDAPDKRKAMMIRDSFGTAMANFVATPFAETCIVYWEDYTPEFLSMENPDVIILEMAERRLDGLLSMEFE